MEGLRCHSSVQLYRQGIAAVVCFTTPMPSMKELVAPHEYQLSHTKPCRDTYYIYHPFITDVEKEMQRSPGPYFQMR